MCSKRSIKNRIGVLKQLSRWSDFDSPEAYFQRPGPWDDKDMNSLFEANKAWRERMKSIDPNFFKYHELGHSPKVNLLS